jgi:hypothetical protein
MRHPLLGVVLLELVYKALLIASSFGLSALVPDPPGDSVTGPSQSLVLVLASAAGVLVLVGTLGWWSLLAGRPALVAPVRARPPGSFGAARRLSADRRPGLRRRGAGRRAPGGSDVEHGGSPRATAAADPGVSPVAPAAAAQTRSG